MAEQMMENGEAQAGQGPGNNGRDPLGRPDRTNRPDLGLSVKVPTRSTFSARARCSTKFAAGSAIRRGPAVELDYLERLIKPF